MRMGKTVIYPVGKTEAVRYAAGFLEAAGITMVDHPTPDATHLLLDVPVRFGGDVEKNLEMLPEDITVIGGNLDHPALAGYGTVDLLRDPEYLAQNAAITAHCAVKVALPYLGITLPNCGVLVIGWGRIGKVLGQLLQALGADVTIAARKKTDRAMIRALGYKAADTYDLGAVLPGQRLVYNTVPEPILSADAPFRKGCVKIELASRPGIGGTDVIQARGLPGVHAPETSGKLIADTIIRLLEEGAK